MLFLLDQFFSYRPPSPRGGGGEKKDLPPDITVSQVPSPPRDCIALDRSSPRWTCQRQWNFCLVLGGWFGLRQWVCQTPPTPTPPHTPSQANPGYGDGRGYGCSLSNPLLLWRLWRNYCGRTTCCQDSGRPWRGPGGMVPWRLQTGHGVLMPFSRHPSPTTSYNSSLPSLLRAATRCTCLPRREYMGVPLCHWHWYRALSGVSMGFGGGRHRAGGLVPGTVGARGASRGPAIEGALVGLLPGST